MSLLALNGKCALEPEAVGCNLRVVECIAGASIACSDFVFPGHLAMVSCCDRTGAGAGRDGQGACQAGKHSQRARGL